MTAGQKLLDSLPTPTSGVTTRRTPEYLFWRYAGFPALAYRAHLVEAAVVDVLMPATTPARRASRAVAAALRDAGADYALTIGRPAGTLPLAVKAPVWCGAKSTPPSHRHSPTGTSL